MMQRTSNESKWHLDWKSKFTHREVKFKKINNQQKKDRRADVYIESSKIVLEIQNSSIEFVEVVERNFDYNLHNITVIWLINGEDCIVKNIRDNKSLISLNATWKSKSFLSYQLIFIDINNKIYGFNPNHVRADTVIASQSLSYEFFIQSLYSNVPYPMLQICETNHLCHLFIKQQGAGTGKTYGIIQSIQSEEFTKYKNIIMITKQHSAKDTIHRELKDQLEKQNLIMNNPLKIDDKKKHIYTYINSKNEKCTLIICTIDAIVYNLGNKQHGRLDLFEGLLHSIITDDIENKVTLKEKSIISGRAISWNSETCIVCDETQDLTSDYAKMFVRIMMECYVDFYLVGDLLQSISFEENAFKYLIVNDLPDKIKKVILPKINKCRRFNNPSLINFVNEMIPFDSYQLPPINNEETKVSENAISIIMGNHVNNYSEKENVSAETEMIMEKYRYEIEINKYKPKDFLIITPFTKSNSLVTSLENAINHYCRSNLEISSELPGEKRFACFHRSELYSSIDTTESDNITRIVSIHSAKGDGRPVVFLIGMSDSALFLFSKSYGLVYNSLVHVAITRMKKKLYIRIERNQKCRFSNKIRSILNIEEVNNINFLQDNSYIINTNWKFNKISSNLQQDPNHFQMIKQNILEVVGFDFSRNLKDKRIIDFIHHRIRSSTMKMIFLREVALNQQQWEDENKEEVRHIFWSRIKKIQDSKYLKVESTKTYNEMVNQNFYRKGPNSIMEFPVIKFQNSSNILSDMFVDILCSLRCNINKSYKQLCPLEYVVLQFLIDQIELGLKSDFSVTELYNIFIIYINTAKFNTDSHKECVCFKYFKIFNKNPYEEPKKNKDELDDKYFYIQKHYNDVHHVRTLYKNLLEKHPKITWTYGNCQKFNGYGSSKTFEIKNTFEFVGYNKEDLIILYIQNQFTEINQNPILINMIHNLFFINNINYDDKFGKAEEIYKNKKVTSIVFSPDCTEGIILPTNNKEPNFENSQNIIKKHIKQLLYDEIINPNKSIFSELYDSYKPYSSKGSLIKEWFEKIKDSKVLKHAPILQEFVEYIYDNRKVKMTLDTFSIELEMFTSRKLNKYFGIYDDEEDSSNENNSDNEI